MSAAKEASDRIGHKSGGPRTAAGKARTRGNALKHGLASTYKHDVLLFQQTKRLAHAICSGDDNELLFEQAMLIAENELALRRINAQQLNAIERLRDPLATPLSKGDTRRKTLRRVQKQRDLAYSEFSQLKNKLIKEGKDVTSFMNARMTSANKIWKYEHLKDRDEFEAMQEAIGDLERLQRYERRAWSRRNRAIREFMALKATQ
jgi:hypothetical protein